MSATSPPCPQCGVQESNVVDSRGTAAGPVYRRRECECGYRFTTRERSEDGMIPVVTLERMRSELAKVQAALAAIETEVHALLGHPQGVDPEDEAHERSSRSPSAGGG